MTELLTAAQMRAIEQAAIASGEVTGLELMERAGRGVVEAIFEEWPELKATSHRAVVLCGPGNNGGDGFVVARLLKEWGWEVEVLLYGDPEKLPPDARVNYERWRGMGEVVAWNDNAQKVRLEEGGDFDLVVDALFGTGLSRPMLDDTSETWQSLMPGPLAQYAHSDGDVRFVAIDVPSGMCSDSGKDMGAMPAHLTVTFHRPKVGHYLQEKCGPYGGANSCNKLSLIDIGLPQAAIENSVWLTTGHHIDVKKICGHKYSHGYALILSGPPGQTGAARLAARGALRIGAGLVTVGAVPDAIPEHAAQLTAIMLREVANGAALTQALADPRINALCLGPGLGLDDRARGLMGAALQSLGDPGPTRDETVGRDSRRLVLDADALTLLSRHPELFAALNENCILTPHAGEFARLFPDIAEKLAAPATTGPAYSKVDATREAAKRAGCVVLYKGADTVIADPQGRCSINSAHYERAAPWLATAGSGDVLSGFIAGLLARGFTPMQAAETAAWLHVDCALSFGPGLIAEDLPEELPKVFRKLGL
ncbi:NAD(P)H-hydrate dehydratase [Frigidibacter sp. RF13]|uniref:NAD(P)H-hydrate dehydratase n=1 Tax=Frigidibacter sp. RF13 TaxID=2997340 RepID=UPI00226F0526|nr:NAD(P)H-hydrate dehydratase [Frigidibacter sp. RF13]MCY1125452.1 NAD(P)H-hydrate dehydratase [Frigidibacter sp. RF13]